MADSSKIPKSRVRRTAKIGGLAAGQAIRQAGTVATNVVRTKEGREAALERRNMEAAEQIVTALGTMKGAAMKVGQVLSFVDTGLIPPEHRDEFQRKLARLRDAAPTVTFKEMRKVIEQELDDPLDRGRSPSSTRNRSRPPRSARSTGRGCTTAARWRSRCSTPVSPPRFGPTCRTSA